MSRRRKSGAVHMSRLRKGIRQAAASFAAGGYEMEAVNSHAQLALWSPGARHPRVNSCDDWQQDITGAVHLLKSRSPARYTFVEVRTLRHIVPSSVFGFSAIFNHLIRHNFIRDMSVAKGTKNTTKHKESRP